jgi:hypothetical protein
MEVTRTMRHTVRFLAGLTTASLIGIPAAAQRNPWAIELGSYRSVSVSWRGSGSIDVNGQVLGSGTTTAQALYTPTALRMTFSLASTIQGVTNSGSAWSVWSGDTESSDNGTDTISVEPSFRSLLAREFTALAAGAKAKVLANLRTLGEVAIEELDAAPDAVGEKSGTATVAGQSCDVYNAGGGSVCVLSQAPSVMLRFRTGEASHELVATEVRFNVPVPSDAFANPRGKVVQRVAADEAMVDRGWALEVFAEGNDGAEPPNLAALARYVVQYLSTADLAGEPRGEPSGR